MPDTFTISPAGPYDIGDAVTVSVTIAAANALALDESIEQFLAGQDADTATDTTMAGPVAGTRNGDGTVTYDFGSFAIPAFQRSSAEFAATESIFVYLSPDETDGSAITDGMLSFEVYEPTIPVLTVTQDASGAHLSWTASAHASNALYQVKRKTTGAYANLGSAQAGLTKTDATRTAGTTYTYEISTSDDTTGASGPFVSNQVTINYSIELGAFFLFDPSTIAGKSDGDALTTITESAHSVALTGTGTYVGNASGGQPGIRFDSASNDGFTASGVSYSITGGVTIGLVLSPDASIAAGDYDVCLFGLNMSVNIAASDALAYNGRAFPAVTLGQSPGTSMNAANVVPSGGPVILTARMGAGGGTRLNWNGFKTAVAVRSRQVDGATSLR
jgi:hypothetical protein